MYIDENVSITPERLVRARLILIVRDLGLFWIEEDLRYTMQEYTSTT